MDLEEHDIDYKPQGISFEELLKQCGVRKPKGEKIMGLIDFIMNLFLMKRKKKKSKN